MIEFKTEIQIKRPTDDVFRFIADFENTPKWNYFVTSVKKLSTGPVGLGTKFHQVRKTDQQEYEVIAFEPPSVIEIKTTGGSVPSFRIRYHFKPVSGGTHVRDSWVLETQHNALIERLGAIRIRTAVIENLGKLKQLLETGTAQLQDGPISKFPIF